MAKTHWLLKLSFKGSMHWIVKSTKDQHANYNNRWPTQIGIALPVYLHLLYLLTYAAVFDIEHCFGSGQYYSYLISHSMFKAMHIIYLFLTDLDSSQSPVCELPALCVVIFSDYKSSRVARDVNAFFFLINPCIFPNRQERVLDHGFFRIL